MKNFNQAEYTQKPCMEVYGQQEDQSQDIVDLMCRIVEEDGPRPMRNMRPAQKHRNAADQFHSEQLGAYEAHSKRSRDRLDTVHLHNSGYPKMHDELHKRRSTGKITALNTQRFTTIQQAAYNFCNNCIKNTKKADPKKRIALNRSANKRKAGSRQANSRSRVVKPKPQHARDRNPPCRCRQSKLKINSYCQYSPRPQCLALDKKSGTADTIQLNLDDKMATEGGTSKCRNVNKDCECTEGHKPNCISHTSSNNNSSKRNDTDASVSSYNSYTSLEHEPMGS